MLKAGLRTANILFLLVIGLGYANGQGKPKSVNNVKSAYLNSTLGFRYVPPLGMSDKTARVRQQIQEQATTLHLKNTLDALLAMSSGPDDTEPRWGSITIESYPRRMLQKLDDVPAELQMSAWVARSQVSPARPRIVMIGEQTFAVSLFGSWEGGRRKGAVVWTTIRKGQLLSFAFVANSPARLQNLTESMKTVRFSQFP